MLLDVRRVRCRYRRVLGHTRTRGIGPDLPYQRSTYHYTWLNERAVEIPLAAARPDAAVVGASPATALRVLEVGNVLPDYLPARDDVRHTVVDKYEWAAGLRNLDVVDLPAARDLPAPFGLVLGVSTVEHVGWTRRCSIPGSRPGPSPRSPICSRRADSCGAPFRWAATPHSMRACARAASASRG